PQRGPSGDNSKGGRAHGSGRGRPWWGHDLMAHVAVKEAVLPFGRFPGVDTILGPEMRSTGEVMGIDRELGLAFAKSQAGGGWSLPAKGAVFVSVADRDRPAILGPVQARVA